MTEDQRAMYSALSAYHNTIVGVRFTATGLHIAATAFLAQLALPTDTSPAMAAMAAVLGATFTIFILLLELRNAHLLDNVLMRGKQLEDSSTDGFFDLMKNQTESKKPKCPFIGNNLWLKVSHKVVLSLTYVLTLFFWIIVMAYKLK